MSNIPKIRFKGFTEDWEQCKLGEVGKARSGIGFPDAEQGGVEGIPFFKVSDMNTAGNENEMTTANNYVTEAQIVSHRWHPITELPALFFAKVGAAVMLNRKRLCRFPFLLDNNTMAYSLNEDCWDADFAKALFETVDLTTLIQVGALPSYNAGDVENMEIYLPAHSEQQKIGALFKHIDNLITLHQRKCDELSKFKKFMLQKMFPKANEQFSEIRFKGFTEAWEQRKLGDIVTPYADPVPTPTNGYFRLGIRSHAKGTFHNYVRPGMELETAQMYRVAPHNFIVNITFGWEHAVAITDENDAGKLVSHRFPQFSFNSGMVPDFFKFAIMDDSFRHHLWLASPGGAGRNRVLKINEMLEYKFWVPSSDEQKHIAELLESLDDRITLHQRQLRDLQNIKKYMLQNMFV